MDWKSFAIGVGATILVIAAANGILWAYAASKQPESSNDLSDSLPQTPRMGV